MQLVASHIHRINSRGGVRQTDLGETAGRGANVCDDRGAWRDFEHVDCVGQLRPRARNPRTWIANDLDFRVFADLERRLCGDRSVNSNRFGADQGLRPRAAGREPSRDHRLVEAFSRHQHALFLSDEKPRSLVDLGTDSQ